ncbi:MAG: WD40 repeat domain-containing protein [Polyangiales bacterium]
MDTRVDAYGDPLPPFAIARLGTLRWRQGVAGFDDVTVARDAATAFVTGAGVTAMDLATGLARWSLDDPGATHADLLCDDAGDLLVTVGLGGTVSFVDVVTGARRAAVALPCRHLLTVAASHDGRTVVVGGFDGYGALLRPDGTLRAALAMARNECLHSACFAPDDATVVTSDAGGSVSLWSVTDGTRLRTFGRSDLSPHDAVFTPDGARLVVPTSAGVLVIFDVRTADTLARWRAHGASIASVVVTPDGARAVTVGDDGALSLWDLATHARLATRRVVRGSGALALTPDGRAVAFAEGPRLVLFDLERFTERAPTTESTVPVQAVVVSRDGGSVVTLAGGDDARWWSIPEGALQHKAPLAVHVVGVRAFPEPDRHEILATSNFDNLALDVAARTLTPCPPPPEVHRAWTGGGARAVIFRGRLTLTNAAGVAHARKVDALDLRFTPDGRYALILDRSRLTCWDLERQVAVSEAKARGTGGLALAPAGDQVIAWTMTSVRRLGVPDGLERAAWTAPAGLWVQGVAYAPQGDRLAVATGHDTRVLDVATVREVARVEGPAFASVGLAFTPDGAHLVTAWTDSTALLWRVDEAVAGHAPEVAERGRGRSARTSRGRSAAR